MSTVRKVPMRKCVGCNEIKNKKELIRIMKTPEGEILMDATGIKNGRGAYVCRSPECLLAAVRNKGLERSLGVKIPEEIYENLKKEMDALEQ